MYGFIVLRAGFVILTNILRQIITSVVVDDLCFGIRVNFSIFLILNFILQIYYFHLINIVSLILFDFKILN